MEQQHQRVFRPQRICYPDKKNYVKIWIRENPGLSRERIEFRDPSGHAGVSMFLLLDKGRSELEGILEDAGQIMENFTHQGEITLIASWSEYYPRKGWNKVIEVGAGGITRGELAIQAAELFKKVVDDLKEEQGDDPYIEDDLPLRYHPVSFDQLVLICMDKISNEEEEEEDQDWWQVMIAIDIMTTNGE